MRRELSYKVPYKRLAKLGRSAGRKAYQTVWLWSWFLVAAFIAACFGLGFYSAELTKWLEHAGVPLSPDAMFFLLLLLFLAGMWQLRRLRVRQVKGRVNFDSTIRLTQDEGGLRIATESIEYYVKWQGISQMLVEHDGVAISHGNLFWLVPDTAFESAAERRAFIQEVYGRLSEQARTISEKHVRPALAG
jgi:hypothetical protein